MSSVTEPMFGKVRSFFWPIQNHELRKLVPMWLTMFFITFNYSILRCMKETLVVSPAGAEVLPFIKVWVMLPMALLMTVIFTRLTNRYSQEKVFYIIISGFVIAFAFFAFIVYPFSEQLHPHAFADLMETKLPLGFKGLISMFRYWTFTGFYVVSELWGIIVLSVLFWGFANEVTQINEARRFYGVLGVASNLATIVAGQAAIYISQPVFNPRLPFGGSAWEQTVMLLVMMVISAATLAMMTFRWLNKKVLNDPNEEGHARRINSIKMKKKLSVKESFSFLSRSKYLICIALLVMSYHLVINMVEIVWKDQLRKLYPSPTDFNNYLNNLTSMVGVISTITALFMGRIINRLGWTFTALITPVVMLVTCTCFFIFVVFQGYLGPIAYMLIGTSPLVLAVFFGGAQNCLSKAAKYSVFDGTKEMSFIPLDQEYKLKGKAAIDGVGSRLGKSGGSAIHTVLLMIFGTVGASSPYVAVILIGVIIVWICAVTSLGKQFNALVDGDKKVPEEKAPQVWPDEIGGELKAAS